MAFNFPNHDFIPGTATFRDPRRQAAADARARTARVRKADLGPQGSSESPSHYNAAGNLTAGAGLGPNEGDKQALYDKDGNLVGYRNSPAIRKAKAAPQVAVYTADGKLVGTVDQAKINPVASATPPADPKQAKTAAAAGKVVTNLQAGTGAHGEDVAASPAAETASEDLQKAMRGAAFGDLGLARVAKSAGATGTVEQRYEVLTKAIDVLARDRTHDAVALLALRIVGAGRVDTKAAIRIAKSAALDAAAAEIRNRRRTGRVPAGSSVAVLKSAARRDDPAAVSSALISILVRRFGK